MSQNFCPICNNPKPSRVRGKTCGSRVCRGKLSAQTYKMTPPYPAWEPQWPTLRAVVQADFSAHEVVAKDGGYGFKIIKADDRSYAGCSAAYAAGIA